MGIFTREWAIGKDAGLLVFRIAIAVFLLYGHGFGKLSTIFSGQEIQFMDPIGIGPKLSFYLAAFAEGICAILLILGLFTRFAAFVIVINFLVIVNFHKADGFEILESRLLYHFGFIALVLAGAGKYSLDKMFVYTK
ncbi:MAG TPA: DoxX family protein [Edaphocola sp.]|nr:DoxX family protein [Edaphocola sp.]